MYIFTEYFATKLYKIIKSGGYKVDIFRENIHLISFDFIHNSQYIFSFEILCQLT